MDSPGRKGRYADPSDVGLEGDPFRPYQEDLKGVTCFNLKKQAPRPLPHEVFADCTSQK